MEPNAEKLIGNLVQDDKNRWVSGKSKQKLPHRTLSQFGKLSSQYKLANHYEEINRTVNSTRNREIEAQVSHNNEQS